MEHTPFYRRKRFWIALATTILFVIYFTGTDPNTGFIKNLPYGASLILTLGIFVLASVGLWVMEIFYDFFLDPVFGKEKRLIDEATNGNQAAALASLSKSIRILAAAIVIAGAMVALGVS